MGSSISASCAWTAAGGSPRSASIPALCAGGIHGTSSSGVGVAKTTARLTQEALADWLVADGLKPAEAREIAAVILAALQGALALARATRSKFPLEVLPKHISLSLGQPASKSGTRRPHSDVQ